MTDRELADRMLKGATCVYLACEESVAADISAMLSGGAGVIDRLTKELDDLRAGQQIILPQTIEHAKAMSLVADFAIKSFNNTPAMRGGE